jgi:hypothetical protein
MATAWRSAAGQGADRLLEVAEVDAHRQQLLAADRLGLRVSRNLNGPKPTRGSLPRKKFRHTDISWHRGQVLEHGGDPGAERVARRAERRRLAVDEELALGRAGARR